MPGENFEGGIQAEETPVTPVWAFDLGGALTEMRASHKMKRLGWNNNDQYIEINFTPPAGYRPFIVITLWNGAKAPWLASATDLLASDYVQVV
jgi:hypothetical protein